MRFVPALLSLVLLGPAGAGTGGAIQLELDTWRVTIEPTTLAAKAEVGAFQSVLIAAPSTRPHTVQDFEQGEGRASWTLSDIGVQAEFEAQGNRLLARFRTPRDTEFSWPESGDAQFSGLILPEGEGLYVAFDDVVWRKRMSGECATVGGQLSMPFWSFRLGQDARARTLTYFVRTELRNVLCLEDRDGRFAARLTREFSSRDGVRPQEIEIWFGGASPIAPALEYRERLRAAGTFVNLEQKIRANPEVAKLAGATHMYVWGDGRKPEFVAALVKAGARRAWVGYDQDEFSKQTQADKEFISAAKAAGFLVGPYEVFSNAQDPRTGDALSRWPGTLYPDGCVVDRNGKRRDGFANRGCELSSEALARAEANAGLITARIRRQLRDGANSYFVDVDAFGDLYDDYSPSHPMTVFGDRENRLRRLQLAREHKVVLGSEEGVAWSVPLIDFAHGAFAVRNKVLWEERHTFGKWWPPDRPGIFFNSIEPSAEFRASKFDPAARLPLYEAVFHDAVVATDRWDVPMAQFPTEAATRQLLELLYGLPSMWVMDQRLLAEWNQSFRSLLAFFQPLHERIAWLPLTSFEWLTPDRRVQRTRFGDEVALTVNFSQVEFPGVDPGCLQAVWRDGRTETFCPVRHPAPTPVTTRALQ